MVIVAVNLTVLTVGGLSILIVGMTLVYDSINVMVIVPAVVTLMADDKVSVLMLMRKFGAEYKCS